MSNDLSFMVGKTVLSVDTPYKQKAFPNSLLYPDDEIVFKFTDGTSVKFYHNQDCCESVTIDDINGDFEDLVGQVLLVAEEREGEYIDAGYEVVEWTFYTFRSIKGSVDVKWYGSSNGYYSTAVHIKKDWVLR